MHICNLEDCDVVDKDKLGRYRIKREEWISWFNTDEHHALWKQIHKLSWDFAFFQTINDLRKRIEDDPSDEVGFNSSLRNLFDAGFAITQSVAIRRLTENYNRNPTRNVISLRRLIKELKENRDLITREIYVCNDGLPYDVNSAYNKWKERTNVNHVGPMPNTGPEAWVPSEQCHKSFDFLSKISQSCRNRDDLMSLDWFDRLKDELDNCIDVSVYVNKFIAHAADPISRQNLTPDQTKINLDKFTDCHKAIYKVANFIFAKILYAGATVNLVPVPQFDHLKDIDKPLILTNKIEHAYLSWEKNIYEINKWEIDFPVPDGLPNTDSDKV